MNCRDATHFIFAARDGALDESQRASLAAHVAGCANCRRIQENLAVTVEAWRADVHDTAVPNVELEWQKVRREIRARREPKRSMATWVGLPLAAAAAVAVGLYIAPLGREPSAGKVAPQVAAVTAPPPSEIPDTPVSTVVYVDDKSGWTFVWAPETGGTGQHI